MKIYLNAAHGLLPHLNAMRTNKYVTLTWDQLDNSRYLKHHLWNTISLTRHKKAYPELMAMILSGEVILERIEE